MEVSCEIIQHSRLSNELLDRICRLKDTIWPHGYDSQKHWIYNNIGENDFHLILLNDNRLVGYLNMVHRIFSINETDRIEMLGIGNVCVSKSHQKEGFGVRIVAKASEFLVENDKPGALLCKESLIDFYALNNWILAPPPHYGTKLKNIGGSLMTYNLVIKYNRIELLGEAF